MAGIDKIYGTNDQYDEFYEWAKNNNTFLLASFYPRDDFDPNPARPIANFTESDDMWLLEFCPIKWVTDRIKEQYSLALGE